ncbi:hypothetical protein LRP88_05457 [Fusarium phalaenopsidis]
MPSSSSSLPAPFSSAGSARVAPQWPSEEISAKWLLDLKEVYNTDPEKFYLHIDACSWREQMTAKIRVFRVDDYSDWVALNYGRSRYFTGLFQALPRATLTACLQAIDVTNGHPGSCVRYMKWQLPIPEFPLLGSRIPKKIYTATQKYTAEDFQHVLLGMRETSHLCDFSYCLNSLHLVAESHRVDMRRGRCFQRARADAERGMRIREHCTEHSPPCLLRLACEPGTGKVVTEYESLGNPVVQNLPTQVKSTKGPPLLVSDIQIFRWEDGVRVRD